MAQCSAPPVVAATAPTSGDLGVDLSAGGDLEMAWGDAGFPDVLFQELVCPIADAGGDWDGMLRSPARSVSAATATGLDTGPRRGVMPARAGGQGLEGGRPTVSVADAGCQSDAPQVGLFQVAEAVALAAMAKPTYGPLRLSHNVARLLDIDTPVDTRMADVAAVAVAAYERQLMDYLQQLAADGLLRDATAASSLATVVTEMSLRRRRPAAFGESAAGENPRPPPLPLPEPAIVIDDEPD